MNNGVKSIIFSKEMLQAVVEGRKTQTRRVIRPQPVWDGDAPDRITDVIHGFADGRDILHPVPYGPSGTHLYVKETHRLARFEHRGEPYVEALYRFRHPSDHNNHGGQNMRVFPWSKIPADQRERLEKIKSWGQWRSPRFMYRFLARVWLEVVEIRAERVQDITRDDVIAEGGPFGFSATWDEDFAQLWDSINADRGFSWKSSPWVWVVSFKLNSPV